jgi:hypothetical protein
MMETAQEKILFSTLFLYMTSSLYSSSDFRECKQYPLNNMSNKVCKQLIHHSTQFSQ